MRLALEPSTDPGDHTYRHQIRVRFAETDAMSVVHHAAYPLYLEETRVAWLRHIGHPYASVRSDDGVDFGVLECFVQYRLPLRFDELVDVWLTVGAITRTTFQIAYLLTVDSEVRATGVTVHGAMSMNGRPTRLPGWVALLATGDADDPPERDDR